MKICSRKKCKKIVESPTFKQCQKCRDKGKKDYQKRTIRKNEKIEVLKESVPEEPKIPEKIPEIVIPKIKTDKKDPQFLVTEQGMKKCRICFEIKTIDNYYKNIRYTDNYVGNCKVCHSVLFKEYYNKKYHSVMIDRLKNDLVYKLKQNVKSYIHIQLKNQNKKKTDTSSAYLGCTIDFLRKWLIFNNKNYNSTEYHMDHVVPLSLFDLNKQENIDIAFNWTNIQVLPKKENLKKSNNFNTIEYFNHLLNVHRYISFTTKNFLPLQNQLKYIKNRKLIATLSNCGNSLTV